MNVVPMWGLRDGDREAAARAVQGMAEASANLAKACAGAGQAMQDGVRPLIEGLRRNQERRTWAQMQRQAADGDQGAVLYLLRTPRP